MQTALVLPVPGPTPAPVVPPLVTSKVPESAPLKSQSKPTRAKSAGADTSASPASPAAIIVFGLDAAGRKHGAQFAGADADIAERAADLMDLYCFPADTEALRELAAKLPVGRLFPASGKALVPFTSAMVYNRLCAATDTPATPRPVKAAGKPADAGSGGGSSKGGGAGGSGAGDPPASRIGAKAPADFTQIGLGSTAVMSAYLDAMRSYARFQGRTDNRTFLRAQWVFIPLIVLSFGVFGLPFVGDGTGMGSRSIWPILFFLLIVLPHAVPWAALMVRRLHDMNRTGEWALLALLPFGIVVPFPLTGLVIWGSRPGTPGPNRFGPDPLGREPVPNAPPSSAGPTVGATIPSAASPPAQQDVIAEIERLAQLRASGTLTETEFEVMKAQALGHGGRA